jgi:multiple sugar transport system substrate-binding protein
MRASADHNKESMEMRGSILKGLLLAALLIVPAYAQDKPLAGQSITVLLPWAPQGVAEKFEAETGIHVDLQTLSWDDVRPKLVTAFLAGTAPADVAELDWSWTGQFSAAEWLTPLNGLIDADTVADIKGNSIFTIDGNLLAVPYTNDFRVMLINQKHFDEAGVTTTPKTLDELVAAAKAIKAKGIVQYPIGLPLSPTEGASTSWYLLTKAFGGELFDAELNPLFTSPDSAGYKALAFELQLLKDGLVDPASVGLRDSQINDTVFAKGLTSIMLSGEPGRLSQMNDPKQSQIPGEARAILVATESGQTRSYGLLEGLSIPKFSQHQDAALAFVKWYTSADTQTWLYDNGVMPTRTSVLASLNESGKLLSGDVLVEQSKYVEPLFAQGTPTWYPQFSGAVSTSINSAAKGEISVDEAVQAIADAVQQAKAQ